MIDFSAQLIKAETNELKDKSQKINETVIGSLETVKNNDKNLPNSTHNPIKEIKNVDWFSVNGINSLHFQPVFISITNAILILAVGFSIIYISTLHGTKSSSKSHFRNKRFALNEMFQRNASKFAIFYV